MDYGRSDTKDARLQLGEWSALCLFIVILLLGGAGDTAHLITALTQTAALALMALLVLAPHWKKGSARSGPLRLLCVAIVAMPLMHLVPLPPSIWSDLPGRAEISSLLGNAGVSSGWRPLSLDPQMTIEAGLELLPLLAALWLGWRAGTRLTVALIVAIVIMALLSSVLGGVQRLAGDGWLSGAAPSTSAPGLFINRNHQALFLVLALPLAGWLATWQRDRHRSGRGPARWIVIGIGLVLIAGALATGSRAGLLLLPIALVSVWLVVVPGGQRWRWAMPALLGVALAGGLLMQSNVAGRPLERLLGGGDDSRAMIREGTTQLIARDWPVGTGLGTFVRTWPAVEPVESMGTAYINHAHNDALELAAEGGVLPLLLAILGAGAATWAWRRRRAVSNTVPARSDHALRIAALAGLGLVVLHSLGDFPLRMMSIGAVTGLLLALFLRPLPPQESERGGGQASALLSARKMAAVTLLLGLLWAAWALALSRIALERGDPSAALHAWPWSSEAQTDVGYAALVAGRMDEGKERARAAIHAAPLNLRAYGLLVLGLESRNVTAQSRGLIVDARKLGHREPRLEYRAMELATDAGDYAAAARQVDILLRQDAFRDQTVDFARSLATDPIGVVGLAQTLARNPPWRSVYMRQLASLRMEDVDGHADLLTRLRRSAHPPTPPEINALLSRQIALGLFEGVAILAQQDGRAVAGRLLPEGAGQAGADPATFGWDVRTGTGGDAWIEPAKPALASRIELRAQRTMVGPVLVRRVMRGAGPATLVWSGRQSVANGAQALRWSMTCEQGNKVIAASSNVVNIERGGAVSGTVQFAVPANCPLQILTGSAEWQDAGDFSLTITGVELR